MTIVLGGNLHGLRLRRGAGPPVALVAGKLVVLPAVVAALGEMASACLLAATLASVATISTILWATA